MMSEWILYVGEASLVPERFRALDSTAPTPAVTGNHVHVRPETTAPASRAPSDEAAGYGEHPRYHR